MEQIALSLIALGLLFLAGLAADRIGDRTRLPRVTLLIGCGLIAGQSGYDLIPVAVTQLYPLVSIIALTMVAFLLGSSLSLRAMVQHGRAIVLISLTIVIATLAIVAFGLWAMGLPLAAALVLGALATATDPAATFDVIRQSRTDSAFTRTLKGIVAIDDAWGLIAFSLALVAVRQQQGLFGAGAAGIVRVRRKAAAVPAGDDRIGPGPGGLDLVAAHEQGLVAADHIHDQPFIGVLRAA